MTSAPESTSDLCRLQKTQMKRQQLKMQQANPQRAAQTVDQPVSPGLAVIQRKRGQDHCGLVWIYLEPSELLSKL